jgi:propanediol utilization protein
MRSVSTLANHQMNHVIREAVTNSSIRVPVAISPSHVHLTHCAIEQLFCDRYRLHEQRRLGLSQFAAVESVLLIGPNGQATDVRVIGPPRQANQVELSRADAVKLGIDAPKRTPGDIDGTPGILIKGPRTELRLEFGVIRALPHIHMGPKEADRLGLQDQESIDVVSESDAQRLLFRGVPVCVSADYQLQLHLDADDGDAAGLASGGWVMLRRRLRPESTAINISSLPGVSN